MSISVEEFARKYGFDYCDDVSVLAAPVEGKGFTLKNAIAIQPMEGCDGTTDGAPGELTYRRYKRFADGGAGLIWAEAISVCPEGRANPRQLMLTEDNIDAFRRLTDIAHSNGAKIIAQLTHSGRWSRPVDKNAPIRAAYNAALDEKQQLTDDYPVADDDYLDALPAKFGESTRLAMAAGFDGVDIKACHLYLYSELLGAFNRPGKYGGSYENRTRLLKDSIEAAKKHIGNGILASRFNMFDGTAGLWGKDKDGNIDLSEPLEMVRELSEMGVVLMNITMGTPYFNPHVNRPYNRGGYVADEAPSVGVKRLLEGCGAAQRAVPDVVCLATGFSWLGEYAPGIAAALINSGGARLAGFGRMAFAYPDLANDIVTKGRLDHGKCCVTCSLCTRIMRGGGPTGCPVRDQEVYLAELRKVDNK